MATRAPPPPPPLPADENEIEIKREIDVDVEDVPRVFENIIEPFHLQIRQVGENDDSHSVKII